MKILRVVIKNIASIADGEIDFTKAPLSDAPIFLINGPTGAGKTTILNAICLALFNEAPCFKRSSATQYESVSSNDPLNLLRRGAGRGSVTLDFVDNTGNKHTASWVAHRKYDKPDGKFQKLERVLTCHKTGETITNINIIKARIPEILGLNFDQFCRTTMLAQGEFSRFLHGKDDEKGEILEKLTGMEQYSLISKAIHQKFTSQKTICDNLQLEISAAHLLSESEIREKQEANSAIAMSLKEKETEAKTLAAAVAWLDKIKTVQKQLETCIIHLETANRNAESEQIKSTKKTISAWHATAQIRSLLADAKKLEQDLADYADVSKTHASQFRAIRAGLMHLKSELAKLERDKLTPTLNGIAEMEQQAAIFAEAGSIGVLATQIDNAIKDSNTHKNKAADFAKEIADLAAPIAKAEEQCASCKSKLDEKQKIVDTCISALEGIDSKAIIERTNALNNQKAITDKAVSAIKQYNATLSAATELAAAIKEAKDDLEKEEAAKKINDEKLALAADALAAWEKIYNTKSTLKSHIAELQQAFEEHETCPLCGSLVDRIYSESELDEDIKEAISRVNDAKKKRDDLNNAIATSKATIKLLKDSIKEKEKSLSETNKTLAKEKEAAEKAAKDCGFDAINDDTLKILGELSQELSDEHKKAQDELNVAIDKQNQKDEAVKLRDEAKTSLENAQKKCIDLHASEQKKQASKSAENAAAEMAIMQMEESLKMLNDKLGDAVQCDVHSYSQTCSEIKEKAKLWTQLCNNKSKYEKERDALNTSITNVAAAIARISAYIPDTESVTAAEMEDIENAVGTLADEAANTAGSIENLKQQLKKKNDETKAFFDSNPGITAETVALLSTYDQTQIDTLQATVDKAVSDAHQAKGALDALKKQYDEAIADKPSLCAEKEEEEIRISKDIADSAIEAEKEEKVRLETSLKENEERRKAVSDKETKLKSAKEMLAKWDVLQNMFGSADGKKFKLIAQSTVLQVLLHNANYYMTKLAPRYRLTCEPDSLAIFVIDSFNGNTRRHSTMLSGGETFAVSLALALALSDITKDRSRGGILFIDEGFGSLSADYLNSAVATLQALHSLHGGKVGIISHVESMAEQIPVQIRVKPQNSSTSTIQITE